jgi:hypothetical protein
MVSTVTISDAISLLVAALYTVAGQAHFTARITPQVAETIEQMTPNSHRAFWFLGFDYVTVRTQKEFNQKLKLSANMSTQLKRGFGAFDLIAAALLWRRQTRKAGLALAIVGFSGDLYGQLFNGDDITQVATLLCLSILGSALAPKDRREY